MDNDTPNLSLRDLIAIKTLEKALERFDLAAHINAVGAAFQSEVSAQHSDVDGLAALCYRVADGMLAAREGKLDSGLFPPYEVFRPPFAVFRRP